MRTYVKTHTIIIIYALKFSHGYAGALFPSSKYIRHTDAYTLFSSGPRRSHHGGLGCLDGEPILHGEYISCFCRNAFVCVCMHMQAWLLQRLERRHVLSCIICMRASMQMEACSHAMGEQGIVLCMHAHTWKTYAKYNRRNSSHALDEAKYMIAHACVH
jgi:hypothetical protein